MAEPPVVVSLTRLFGAAPERVFDAWLDPAMIGRWMFGPAVRDEEVIRISVDPRIGGRFSFLVRREDREIDHVGTYLELERPRRLAFTWGIAGEADESRVSLDIAPHGTGTGSELALSHELHPDWADYARRTETAWAKMLRALWEILREEASDRRGTLH